MQLCVGAFSVGVFSMYINWLVELFSALFWIIAFRFTRYGCFFCYRGRGHNWWLDL